MENVKRERLEMDGIVVDGNKGQFKVEVNENVYVLCTLSGKIRLNSVKILVGDRVTCEISPYDMTKGRIIYRHKN